MLEALEPCCAQALAKANAETAAKSTFLMHPLRWSREAAIVPDGRSRNAGRRHAACGRAVTGDARRSFFHSRRYAMIKTLIAIAVAGAFALPVAALASAGSDNIVVAQAGGGSGGADAATSGGQAGSNPPGTASPGSPRDATTSTDRDTGATGRA